MPSLVYLLTLREVSLIVKGSVPPTLILTFIGILRSATEFKVIFLLCNLIFAKALCSKWMYCLHLIDEELRFKELRAKSHSHHDVDEPGLGLVILMGSGILFAQSCSLSFRS